MPQLPLFIIYRALKHAHVSQSLLHLGPYEEYNKFFPFTVEVLGSRQAIILKKTESGYLFCSRITSGQTGFASNTKYKNYCLFITRGETR